MKIAIALATMMVGLLTGTVHAAEPSPIPHQMNLQSLIYDADGNLTQNESVDLMIRILDGDNNVLFTENHPAVPVIDGAVNLSIGSTESMSLDVLDPATGPKFLDIAVGGENPFELMPLVSVPYALWAEKAMTVPEESIESQHIKDGTIKLEDLEGISFSDLEGQAGPDQIPSEITTDAELNEHINSSAAHQASAIVVSSNFANFVASNVLEALQMIDAKVAEEIVNRQNGLNALNQALIDHANQTQGVHGLSTTPGNVVVGTTDPQTLSNKTLESPIINNPVINGGSFSGTLNDTGGNHNGTVEGVDISDLQSTVDQHETRIDTLEAKGLRITEGSQVVNPNGGTYQIVVKSVDTGQVTGTINCAPEFPYTANAWLEANKSTPIAVQSYGVEWKMKSMPYSVGSGTVQCRTIMVADVTGTWAFGGSPVLRWRYAELDF